VTPFAYGALGATAALLRTLHTYIYDRSFDRRRKPEYFNRLLLGTIAGGVVAMFVAADQNLESLAAKVSAGALGFLAGYSTDSLFSTIERILSALLPKVTVEAERPGRGRSVPPNSTPSLQELLNRLGAAQSEDEKTKIAELIDRYYPGGQYS
jgi:fluoride ion exporter CrcB/FEX